MRNVWAKGISLLLVCAMLVTGMVLPVGAVNTEESVVINPSDRVLPVTETAEEKNETKDLSLGEAEEGIKDENGKLLVPFDVVYPEAFDSGEFPYDTSALLIKTAENFEGGLTAGLVGCGVVSLERIGIVTGGVWYRAVLADRADVAESMAQIRALDEVLMADYDYQVESESVEAAQAATYDAIAAASDSWWNNSVASNPRIHEQWYLNSCHIQETWEALAADGINPGGSSSVIVAVIDTGVDYTHPDLASSMWVNPYEIPGNGIDDDGNGYKDDIHGVSTVGSTYNHKGDPMDDHGHGTHVAGIIGAANNKEGIVGIAYNVKIMAVKAGQATGVFNQSDIAEAILYAYENGAEVINMSFGSAACSIAVQEALETASTRATLVAAAGNDGRPDRDGFYLKALPSYPAALQFVIGVMSVNQSGVESTFTNWEFDGTYDVYAPGESILSTLPDGRFGYLEGTSMASPVVAGIVALLRSKYADRDVYPAKYFAAQICATGNSDAICVNQEEHRGLAEKGIGNTHETEKIVDALNALTISPEPQPTVRSFYVFDDISFSEANNGDGIIDAGETIYIGVSLCNEWGMSKDTIVWVNAQSELGVDNPYVEIIDGTADYEGVGTYSVKDKYIRNDAGIVIGIEEPLIIKISEDCPNNTQIVLNVGVSCRNGLNDKDSQLYTTGKKMSFSVTNGVEFPHIIDRDIYISNDRQYVLKQDVLVYEDVTLTIEEGTAIDLQNYDLIVYGNLVFQGTEENPIMISGMYRQIKGASIHPVRSGTIILNYVVADQITTLEASVLNHVIATQFSTLNASEINCCKITSENNSSQVIANRVIYSEIVNADVRAIEIENSKISTVRQSSFTDSQSISAGFARGLTVSSENGGNINYKVSYSKKCSFLCRDNLDTLNLSLDGGARYVECVFNSVNETFLNYSDSPTTVDIQQMYYDTDSQTTYVMLRNAGFWVGMDLAEYLGGSLASLDTQEKCSILQQQKFQGYCGYIPGRTTWLNGSPIGDRYYGKEHLYFNGDINRLYESTNISITNAVIIEIPDSTNLTKEILLDKIEEYSYTYLQNNDFYKCVFLNDYGSDRKIEFWAPEGSYMNLKTIFIPHNYWNTVDPDIIELCFLDFDDEPYQRWQIDPTDFLTEAPSDTMPFVVDVYLLNEEGERVSTVNNETVTFVVEFNRDMDTDIPLKVTFGSSSTYSFEDYNISSYGKYVTPRRWEATYTLKTLIENGNQFFKIENGCAADDEWLKLYDVPGRFMFEIDTTVAQALIMQGHATAEGINLSWTQDDFDTIFGYNVYRATSETGSYTRMNKTVIPYDTKEFLDTTVDSCKVYYYNFTVVKTDLTESDPSGKTSLMSLDTEAPKIQHTPIQKIQAGNNLMIAANVTDNLTIREVRLWYRVAGTSAWKSTVMSGLNGRYTGMVAANYLTASGLEYYIDASDGVSLTKMGSADAPYKVVVEGAEPEPTPTFTPGDVNGDGLINATDVVYLRRHIAGGYGVKINEKAADVNADGVLNTTDVVWIRRYVAGGYDIVLKPAS